MNTTENNKLIAEFMGFKNLGSDNYFVKLPHVEKVCLPIEMRYSESWDWLMPVVDKATQTGDDTNQWDDLADALTTVKIETVYKAVVEFIKWYNENNYK